MLVWFEEDTQNLAGLNIPFQYNVSLHLLRIWRFPCRCSSPSSNALILFLYFSKIVTQGLCFSQRWDSVRTNNLLCFSYDRAEFGVPFVIFIVSAIEWHSNQCSSQAGALCKTLVVKLLIMSVCWWFLYRDSLAHPKLLLRILFSRFFVKLLLDLR